MDFDAITVAPYMGEDSIRPFLEYQNKWTIILGLTSNEGAADFEMQRLAAGGVLLYEKVITTIAKWGTEENLMFVIGATKAEEFTRIRTFVPNHFMLVPGVGFQGGSLADVSKFGMSKNGCGLLVNASRAIIYASEKEDFAKEAAAIARQYQYEMESYLSF
jgi:orotidine-5'-phosphate decarboxylase